jgi:hypothetical protein
MTRSEAGSSDEPGESPVPILQLRAGLAESPRWYLVQAAEFAPEPLTVARLRVRDTYASPRLVLAILELMASEQWLDRAEEEYSLTEYGRSVIHRSREATLRMAAGVQSLLAPVLEQLVSLVGRLVQASLESSSPPGVWCLEHSRKRAPDAGAGSVVQLLQYVADFNAFRDDAHMAAWRHYVESGATWEAFALVCGGETNSLETVYQQLAHRGYTVHEYATALEDLQRRAWLEPGPESGTYQPTSTGRSVRQQVEQLTNSYFYAPWSCLSDTEITRVHDLLVQMQEISERPGHANPAPRNT